MTSEALLERVLQMLCEKNVKIHALEAEVRQLKHDLGDAQKTIQKLTDEPESFMDWDLKKLRERMPQ
jgi:regulator of replication initiation timing